MWKIYHTSRVFKQSLLPNLGLPDEATGSLSLWFEENAKVTRVFGWERRCGRSTGFMQCGDFGLCVKKYGVGATAPLRWVWSHFRYQETKRRYRRHKRIFELGVSVPKPYACLYEYDSDSRPATAYIISQKLENANTLLEYYKSHPTQADMLLTFDALAQVIANLHRCNYMHGDLSWKNIMVNDNKVFLIDLDRGNRSSHPSATMRIAVDIARFTMKIPFSKDNETDAKDINTALSLFLHRYCEASGIDKSQLLIAMHKALDKRKKHYLRKRYLRERLEEKICQVQRACDVLNQLKI